MRHLLAVSFLLSFAVGNTRAQEVPDRAAEVERRIKNFPIPNEYWLRVLQEDVPKGKYFHETDDISDASFRDRSVQLYNRAVEVRDSKILRDAFKKFGRRESELSLLNDTLSKRIDVREDDAPFIRENMWSRGEDANKALALIADEEKKRSGWFNEFLSSELSKSEKKILVSVLIRKAKLRAFEHAVVIEDFKLSKEDLGKVHAAHRKLGRLHASSMESGSLEQFKADGAELYAEGLRAIGPAGALRFLRESMQVSGDMGTNTLKSRFALPSQEPIRVAIDEFADSLLEGTN
ncbi:hypothetical protein [Rhodopirellula baltica]|uniref:Uncharacterized protein n=1 Tax=Rhodopirellula baltica SWK14 TaxID=993516 RepID=L7CKP0_RHOBT|nr:hypothetical protein [Rhodopirellula baltica]ELP34533.1 hypothetical protein RBSWK_01543 [Rhodopirellula baltica SWK14]